MPRCALLRRGKPRETRLNAADLVMDIVRRTVTRGGRRIDLRPKEYALLEYLMRNSDRPVTRSLIIEHVWDIHFDSISNVVEVHINSLRHKIWSLPVTLLAVLIVGKWMAAWALAPLVRLAALTRTIGVDDLRRRLPTKGVGDEHDAIADAFNGVVARLERAVREMKLFAAAMAHELRTPLAALRGEMELSLTDNGSLDAHRQSVASQLEEIDKLARLVDQLLLLAQADAGEIPLRREVVDLAVLGASVVEALEPVAEARNIRTAAHSPFRCRSAPQNPETPRNPSRHPVIVRLPSCAED